MCVCLSFSRKSSFGRLRATKPTTKPRGNHSEVWPRTAREFEEHICKVRQKKEMSELLILSSLDWQALPCSPLNSHQRFLTDCRAVCVHFRRCQLMTVCLSALICFSVFLVLLFCLLPNIAPRISLQTMSSRASCSTVLPGFWNSLSGKSSEAWPNRLGAGGGKEKEENQNLVATWFNQERELAFFDLKRWNRNILYGNISQPTEYETRSTNSVTNWHQPRLDLLAQVNRAGNVLSLGF